MLVVLLAIAASTSTLPVRAEPVEAFPAARAASGPSTSSGRTGGGKGSALDAERAFAADARTLGQWTAFRKWAAPDATMFVPQPTNSQAWLKDRKDPPRAIDWWPTASYESCDGSLTVNTGRWKRPDESVGYFSTVWQRQRDGGWKWIVDGGDDLTVARAGPRALTLLTASCRGDPTPRGHIFYRAGPSADGTSSDNTLAWRWHVLGGARHFEAFAWNGRVWRPVVDDKIAAPE